LGYRAIQGPIRLTAPGRILQICGVQRFGTWSAAGCCAGSQCRWTGHKTESVYRRYAINREADLREGVDRLNDHVVGTNRGDETAASEKQTA
jgi:hypothetical protein